MKQSGPEPIQAVGSGPYNRKENGMSTPPSELKVITSAKNLNSYLFRMLENAPKKYRSTIVARLENDSLSLVECLVRANAIPLGEKRRQDEQTEASVMIKSIDMLAQLAIEMECLSFHQGEVIGKMLNEVSYLLQAWRKSDEKRRMNHDSSGASLKKG